MSISAPEWMFIGLLVAFIAGIAMVRAQLDMVERRTRGLLNMDAKLDLLLTHAGITFDPYQNPSNAVRDALREGERTRAIKNYREATGAGLKEAKDFIDEIQRRSALQGQEDSRKS